MCKPHRCPHIAMTGNICVYCPGGPDSDFEYSTQSYTGYEVRFSFLFLFEDMINNQSSITYIYNGCQNCTITCRKKIVSSPTKK